jgi:DNA (cytosine-5)-methyltransferase 3A
MSVGKEKINVLSLFDGISCGQIALERAEIEVENYFASEIDDYAIKMCKQNYPNTKHIGSVVDVKASDLPKIDLLIGGSPCQDLSISKKDGKGLNGDKSGLFWEYVRLKNELQPKYFLLENVKNKWADEMTEAIGVKPIEINSDDFSAQNRPRLYWTNIPIGNWQKKDVVIADLLFDDRNKICNDFTIVKDLSTERLSKCNQIGFVKKNRQGKRIYDINGKHACLTGSRDAGGYLTNYIYDGKICRELSVTECERLQTIPDGYTKGFSDTQRFKAIGNGWTVDVISFIFSFLRGENFLNSFSHESSIEAQK